MTITARVAVKFCVFDASSLFFSNLHSFHRLLHVSNWCSCFERGDSKRCDSLCFRTIGGWSVVYFESIIDDVDWIISEVILFVDSVYECYLSQSILV